MLSSSVRQGLFGACFTPWYVLQMLAVLDASTKVSGGAIDGPSCCCCVCAEHGRELQQQHTQQELVDGVVSEQLAPQKQQQQSSSSIRRRPRRRAYAHMLGWGSQCF